MIGSPKPHVNTRWEQGQRPQPGPDLGISMLFFLSCSVITHLVATSVLTLGDWMQNTNIYFVLLRAAMPGEIQTIHPRLTWWTLHWVIALRPGRDIAGRHPSTHTHTFKFMNKFLTQPYLHHVLGRGEITVLSRRSARTTRSSWPKVTVEASSLELLPTAPHLKEVLCLIRELKIG